MYHAQQCAEKTLKAFLVFNQYNYPKTHDLGVLINLCAEIEPEFYKLIEKATTLTPNATVFRYVDTLEEADELIEYL
jgi:HEPN domain-containing protein